MLLNDETAKLLEKEETYPDGANSPTYTYRYECPCGTGTIEYVTVPGFDDRYTEILCPACREKYGTRMSQGHLWELVKRQS